MASYQKAVDAWKNKAYSHKDGFSMFVCLVFNVKDKVTKRK